MTHSMERMFAMEFDLTSIENEFKHASLNPLESEWLSLALKNKVSQTEVIPEPDTVCYLTHTDEPYSFLTRGSISTFTGKAKAGKTTVLALLVSTTIHDLNVLWIDTEQGLYYASKTQHYILKVAGLIQSDNLEMFDLRSFNPPQRTSIIEALLKNGKYDLIVIDGVRDLVFDINSSEDATTLITKLMLWSVQYECHITMVLHLNKGNADVRGHLGTEAINKSEVVISVNKLDDGSGSAIVSAEYCRGLPFNDFCVVRQENGIPEINLDYLPSSSIPGRRKLADPIEFAESQHIEVLNLIFRNSVGLKSGELQSGLCSAWSSVGGDSMGQSRAKIFQAYYIQKGFIISKDKQKGNTTLNILNEKYRVS